MFYNPFSADSPSPKTKNSGAKIDLHFLQIKTLYMLENESVHCSERFYLTILKNIKSGMTPVSPEVPKSDF